MDDLHPHSLASEIKAIIESLFAGARYGMKIRFPHALVMTFLFRRDLSPNQKVRTILKLVGEHSSNLAAFAALYKTILATLKWASRKVHRLYPPGSPESRNFLQNLGRRILYLIVDGPHRGQRLISRAPGHPERSHHALMAGAIGGYIVWGRYSGVNYQIVLYLASRVLVALAKRAHIHSPIKLDVSKGYPLFAATVWGVVMILFEESPELLHPSLKKSMDEIYRYSFDSTVSDAGDEGPATGSSSSERRPETVSLNT